MSDNLIMYVTGDPGGTVSTDEVVYGGSTAHMQRMKVHDGSDGGTVGMIVSSGGAAHVHVTNSGTVTLAAGANVVPVWVNAVGTVLGTVTVQGNVAHDSSDGGGMPIKIGGRADSTQQADVADGDRVDALFNLAGMQVVSQGSVVAGLGKTISSGVVNLSATGTVVASVASQKIKVFAEHFTVQGGTVTITTQNGAAGSTIVGPRQFSTGMGVAWANGVESPLYESAAGSPVVFVIVGSGTVGGILRYYTEA